MRMKSSGYFIDRSTNASAESLWLEDEDIPGSALRGMRDMSFFMFRSVTVFG